MTEQSTIQQREQREVTGGLEIWNPQPSWNICGQQGGYEQVAKFWTWSQAAFLSLESKEGRNALPCLASPSVPPLVCSSTDILDNMKGIWYKVLASLGCTCAEALVNVSLKASTCFFYLKPA